MRIFTPAALVLGMGLLLPSAALAHDPVPGLGMSPTSQELTAQPGKVLKIELTVINNGATDLPYTLSASDYSVEGLSYTPKFIDAASASKLSAAKWFSFKPESAIVHAHDQIKVPVTITVPETAAIGGHYAAIFAESAGAGAQGATGVNRVIRVGSIYYIAVGGDLHPAGELKEFKLPWIQHAPPLRSEFTVKNTGNVHFAVDAKSILKPLFGAPHAPILSKGEVLPGTSRRFSPVLPVGSGFGIYQVTLQTNLGGMAQARRQSWVLLIPAIAEVLILSTLAVVAVLTSIMFYQRRK